MQCLFSGENYPILQASYADIARHAAALYTQQAGQQQHIVYREHLQYRLGISLHATPTVQIVNFSKGNTYSTGEELVYREHQHYR